MQLDDTKTDTAGAQKRNIFKAAVDVELVLVDGSQLSGNVFLGKGERVSDLLNAPTLFLPFRMENGEFLLLSKSSIAMCKPLDRVS